MIEQTKTNGQLYLSYTNGTSLISKRISVGDVAFGRMKPITIATQGEDVLVLDNSTGMLYRYQNEQLVTQTKGYTLPEGVFYFYGLARYTDAQTKEVTLYPYLIQNTPQVSIDDIPTLDTFVLPITMQRLDYEQVFDYPSDLRKLLAKRPAAYVDRYKRPIQRTNHRTFPVSIDKVSTTFEQMAACRYPVVVQLAQSPFAVVDLEPGFDAASAEHFNSLIPHAYYVEDTPRGGKHLLVRSDTDTYKFRFSKYLEIINESMVTLYGINAHMLYPNPEAIDVSHYEQTQHSVRDTIDTKQPEQLDDYIQALMRQRESTCSCGREVAQQTFENDDDTSHGEYVALYLLYRYDILPYRESLPEDALPWILAAYADGVIPWREKHDTHRNGVPYLVHLASRIIAYKKL